jgi:limonene-1,2-epoxide hydrolase
MTGFASSGELVWAMLSAWEQRDTSYIIDHFTEDAVYHAMPLRPIVGKTNLRSWVQTFESVPPGQLQIRHQVESDHVVMNERTDRITIQGTEVVLPICAIFEADHGLIKAWREYFDLAGLRRLLGVNPSTT